ncbi:MAG: hypothetical protein P4L50_07040 [Anaerolineaceae bacterium]|nr:hypothetical protein [Anaerolineaceae bacterium]
MKKWLIGVMAILLVAIGSACGAPLAIEQAAGQPPTITLPTEEIATVQLEATSTVHPQGQIPADIAQLAAQAGMTAKAKAIFFAANPEIDSDRLIFEQHCQTQVSANNIELGCYTSDNHIYLLNIGDPRLSEEMVVVAAHEMLHAAYAQLSSSERDVLDAQLEAQVSRIHSTELTQEIRAYRLTEPGQRDNELHSLLGTEFAPLSPGLEKYYAQYFSNRGAIVKDAQNFKAVFTQLSVSLSSLRSKISQMRNNMRIDLARGRIQSYNSLVPQINSLVQEYNQTANQYNLVGRELLGQESSAASQ